MLCPSMVKVTSFTKEVCPRNSFSVFPDFKPWILQFQQNQDNEHVKKLHNNIKRKKTHKCWLYQPWHERPQTWHGKIAVKIKNVRFIHDKIFFISLLRPSIYSRKEKVEIKLLTYYYSLCSSNLITQCTNQNTSVCSIPPARRVIMKGYEGYEGYGRLWRRY